MPGWDIAGSRAVVPLKSLQLDREELKTFSEMRRERRKQTVPGDEHHPTDLVLDGVARVPLPEMRPLGTGFGTDHETSLQPTDLPVLLHGEDYLIYQCLGAFGRPEPWYGRITEQLLGRRVIVFQQRYLFITSSKDDCRRWRPASRAEIR